MSPGPESPAAIRNHSSRPPDDGIPKSSPDSRLVEAGAAQSTITGLEALAALKARDEAQLAEYAGYEGPDVEMIRGNLRAEIADVDRSIRRHTHNHQPRTRVRIPQRRTGARRRESHPRQSRRAAASSGSSSEPGPSDEPPLGRHHLAGVAR